MGKRKSNLTQQENGVQPKKGRKTTQNNNNIPESDDEDDEDVNMAKVQPSTSQPTTSSQAASQDYCSRSGKILAVKLRNFMCHKNLTVEFNRRTNLLVGQNGSGKSAILTALIIGLGSKANATNRSSNVKQLIRTGEPLATIEVHLSNDGSDSYEREKFGDRIIVMRSITAAGTSTYKLKNALGHIMSTSRADLLKMILYMNIQVDNPVCVLTQDASRSFLRDSDPKKRYQLFMKATQMDVIIEKLNGCVEQITHAKSKLAVQETFCESLRIIKQKALNKLQQFQSMEPLKNEIKQYKREQQWLNVIEQENFMQEIKSYLDNTRTQREQFVTKLQNSTNDDRESNQKCVELTENISTLRNHLSSVQKKMEKEKMVYRGLNEKLMEIDRELKKIDAKKSRVQETIDKLQESINEQLKSNKNQVDKLRESNERELAEKWEKKKDLEAITMGSRRDIDMLTNTKNHLAEQFKGLNDERHRLIEEKQRLQTQLKQIHSSPMEHLRDFGDFMPKLVETLEEYHKRGKFKRMPLGPIGNHIEVINPKYRKFVEDALRPLLSSFCVDNVHDLAVFRDVIKTRFPNARQVPTITSKFLDKMYDVRSKCVLSDANSVRFFDIISVDNPNIMNCVIDQCNVETTLFTENFQHAARLTSRKENVPKHLSKVILLNPYSEYFPAPNYRSYTKKPLQQAARYLRISAAQREKGYQSELNLTMEKLAQIENEMHQMTKKVEENTKLLNKRRMDLAKLEPEVDMLRLAISEIEEFKYPQEADITVMENEISEQNKILGNFNKQYDEEEQRKNMTKMQINTIQTTIQEKKLDIQNTEQEIQNKQKSKDEIMEKVSKRESMKNYAEKKIETLTTALEKLTKEHDEAKAKIDKLTVAAEKSGERVQPTHNAEKLAALIKANQKKIDTVIISKETLENVAHNFNQAENNLAQNEELIETLRGTLKMLKNSIQMRFKHMKKLKDYMITLVSHCFTSVCALRDYKGDLIFDSEKQTLDIVVIPRDKEIENSVSKTVNLSGGERSYSTVAFLISLWMCVDHPFYFLDEYDVFTDQVNRMFITKLLLNEAKKKPHQQFTFLTPQDTSEITPSDALSILRLENPGR